MHKLILKSVQKNNPYTIMKQNIDAQTSNIRQKQ